MIKNMAGKEIKVSSTLKEKNGFKLNAQWLKNTTRSLGANAVDVLQDISPNIYSAVSSASQVKRAVTNSRVSQKNVASVLQNNQFIKSGKTAIDNLMKDLKTGNFNNTSRGGFGGGDDDSTTSVNFGEINDASEAEVSSVKAVVNFNPEGLNSINQSITKQTKLQALSAKAQVDTMVATSSAMLAMHQKNADASLNALNNINNSLQAIVKYNNDNMSSFISSSMAFYEMMGKVYAPRDKQRPEAGLSGADLIDRRGQLNLGNLPKLLKQNFSNAYQNTMPGQITSMLSAFGDQIVTNPLKIITTSLMSSVIPKAVKKSTENLDKTFGNFVTEMLMKTSETLKMSEGNFAGFKRFLGEALDINVGRKEKFNTAGKVTNDAAVFDGVVHHAISAEIPKYLRESNSYLRALVRLNGGDPDEAVRGSKIFNKETGTYQRYDDFTKGLMGSINESVIYSMENSDFGKSLRQVADSSIISEKQKDSFNELLNKFYLALEKDDAQRIDITKRGADSDIARIVGSLNGDAGLKRILEASVYSSFEHGRGGININSARLNAKKSRNDRILELEESNTSDIASMLTSHNQTIDEAMADVLYGYDGRSTRVTRFTPDSLLGKIDNIETLLDRGINVRITGHTPYGSTIGPKSSSYSEGKNESKQQSNGAKVASNAEIETEDLSPEELQKLIDEAQTQGNNATTTGGKKQKGQFIANTQDRLGRIMHYIIKGQPSKVYGEFGAMFGDGVKAMGQTVNNSIFEPAKKFVFGTDKDGKAVSLKSKISEVFSGVKEDVTSFIFGEKNEEGKRTGRKDSVMGFLKNGLSDWSKTLFGEEKSLDDVKKEIQAKVQKNADAGIKGAVAGAGLGIASGGILGSLIGGPITGALIGTAGSIASKSKAFQKLIFGKEYNEETGEFEFKGGGLISKETQTFMRENKKHIVGSAAIGTIGGAVTGGGFLGTLVGGPIAGALIGSAVGMAIKSKTFQEFIFGKEVEGEGGRKKRIGGILGAFNKAFSDVKGKDDNTTQRAKALAGRATIGTGAGLLLSMFTPLGPIGGAALGLAGSMIASKNKFHDLLFGKEEDDGEHKGLLGKLGAQISKTVVAPLAGIAANTLDKAKDAIMDKVLDPLVSLAEPLAGYTRRLYEKVEEKVSGTFDKVKNAVSGAMKLAFGAAKGLIGKVFNRKDKGDEKEPKVSRGPLNALRASNRKASSKKWFSEKYRSTNEFKDKYAKLQDDYNNLSPEEAEKFKSFEEYEKYMAETMFYNGGDTRLERHQDKLDRHKSRIERQKERKDTINREALITSLTGGKYSTASEESLKAAMEGYKKTRGYKNSKGMMGLSDEDVQRLLSVESIKKPGEDESEEVKIETEQLGVMNEQLSWLEKIGITFQEVAKGVLGAPIDYTKKGINKLSENRQNKIKKELEMRGTQANAGKSFTDSFNDAVMPFVDDPDYTTQFSYDNKKDKKEISKILDDQNHPMYNQALIIRNPSKSARERLDAYKVYKDWVAKNKENDKAAKIEHGRAKSQYRKKQKTKVHDILRTNVPHNATGTGNAKEGAAVVGENGPEIVRFSGGEHVLSNNDIIKVKVVDVESQAAEILARNKGVQDVNLIGQNGPIVTYGTSARLDGSTDNKTSIEKALEKPNTLVTYDMIKADNDEIVTGNGGDGEKEKSFLEKLGDSLGGLGKVLLTGGAIAGLVKLLSNEKVQELLSKLISGLGDLGKNAGEVAKNEIDTVSRVYTNDGYEGGADFATNIENQTSRWSSIFKDPKKFLLGEDGEWDSQSSVITKAGRQAGKFILNGDSGNVKTANALLHPIKTLKKGAGQLIRHPIKTVKNIGSNIAGAGKSVVNAGKTVGKFFKADGAGKLGMLKDGAVNMFKKTDASAQLTMIKDLAANVKNKGGVDGALEAVNKALDTTNPDRKGITGMFKKLKNFGAKAGKEATEEGVEKVAKSASKAVVKEATEEGVEAAAEKTAKTTILQTASKMIKEGLQKAGEIIVSKMKGGKVGTILSKALKYVDEVIEAISKGMLGKLKSWIMKKLAKLGTFLGVTTGVAATGIGALGVLAKDGLFLAVGALNNAGKGGTARLFRCRQDVVDAKMQIISAAFGGFAETTVGTIIDVINEIYCAITGGDFLSATATLLYKAISKKEDDDKLTGSQKKLKDDWEKYKEDVLKKEYQNYKEEHPNSKLSFEDYKKKVAKGEIDTEAQGFAEYNDEQNKTGLAKFGASIKSGWKKLWGKGRDSKSKSDAKVSKEASKKSTTGGKGGFGIPFYSQKDPRWAGMEYEQGGRGPETMADAGCGPAAFAMAASGSGLNIDPMDAAKTMQRIGARDETGTNWYGIGKAANEYGINSTMERNPSSGFIDSQLNAGKPVVLSGRSSGNTNATPYTSQGHYVVATGKDSSGNYIINDPNSMDGMGRIYNKNAIVNETGAAWGFGGRGPSAGLMLMNNVFTPKLPTTTSTIPSILANTPQNQGVIVKDSSGNTLTGMTTDSGYTNRQKWVGICQAVKRSLAAKKLGYSQSNWTNVTLDGKTISVRTDCSGYVAACLKFYGVLGDKTNITSSLTTDSNNSTMKSTGFTSRAFTSWNDLNPGDIISKSGHVEIFAYNDGSKHYVYNCGSDSSCNSSVPTGSSYKSYTTVWSPGAPGANIVSVPADGSVTETYDGSATASNNSGGNFLTKLGTGLSELVNRTITGITTGNWNNDWSGVFSDNSSGTTGDSTVGSGAVTSDPASESTLWKLFKDKGLSNAGAAGLMGNLHAESGLNTQNLQNSYEKSLGMDDKSYTTKVDNGSYTNFVKDKAGYGLAQWTYHSRKQGLLNKANSMGKSIGDASVQTSYLFDELQGYPDLLNHLKTTSSYVTASDRFMTEFERPKDQSQKAKEKRQGFSKTYYDRYSNSGAGGKGGYGPTTSSVQTFKSNGVNRPETRFISRYENRNTQELNEVIHYLSQILAVLGESSDKLNALNALKNLSQNGGNFVNKTTNVVQNGGNTTTPETTQNTQSKSKKYAIAEQIARGGL